MNERYIVLRSGVRVSLTGIGVPTVHDIAVSLCRTPMFAGASKFPYSVAHHCVAAAKLATAISPEVALFTLLHELEVTEFGDIPGPTTLESQRVIEKNVRDRFYRTNGLEWSEKIWTHVEFYDKVEQAASIRIVGLAEDVHAAVWERAGPAVQDHAIRIVADLYLTCPPKDQLDEISPLVLRFVADYNHYRRQMERINCTQH